jgi:hypothetical protein
METVAFVGAGIFLAIVLERLVELLVKPPLPESLRPAVPYVSAGLGLLIAFGFNIDLVSPTLAQFDVKPAVSWAGRVVTGLLIGGGSNLIHDLWAGVASSGSGVDR